MKKISMSVLSKKAILFLIFLVILLSFNIGFSQEIEESVKKEGEKSSAVDEKSLPDSIRQAFEEAMKAIDSERLTKQEALATNLKSKLKLAVENWISSTRKKRRLEINKLITQNWENIPKFGRRIHYKYNLRDYAYSEDKIDIIKTESLVVPYKACLNITEKLYAERTHVSNVSDRHKFFYTVTMPFKISFEYRKDKFTVTNTEYGKESIKQGWPEELIRKLKVKLFQSR